MNGLTKTVAVATTGLFAMAAPLAAAPFLFSGDLGTTIQDGESNSFDMNNDGILDLSFSLDADGNADVDGLSGNNGFVFSSTTVYTFGDPIVQKFSAGETIVSTQDRGDGTHLGGPRMVNDTMMAKTFEGDLAMWATSGDTGYMGFEITVLPFLAPCDSGIDEVCFDDVQVIPEFLNESLVGFLELERGSIILGQYGISSGSVTIPQLAAVPLPAGLPLLLVGLGAFGIARRRKALAA